MATSAIPETEELLVSAVKSKRVVTLNRPKALNALNLNMIRSLYPRLQEWNDDKRVSMVIVKGSGEKAFCAGGDVLAVTRSAKANDGSTIHRDFFREEYHLNHLIGTCSKPYVALIDGITMGGGCGLSVNGRFRVATERTMLAMPETALGLFPDVGGSYFLSRLKSNLGMYLALTGYRLQGADVYHAGLATHIVNSEDLAKVEQALLDLPSEQITDRKVDQLLKEFRPSDVKPFSLSEEISHIESLFDGKTLEEILKKLSDDGSEWAQKQLKILSKMSPTSMKVTFRQLKEGLMLSYPNVFTMEYRLTQRFVEDHDFHEGCRAILVDKDRNPKWNPAKVEDVTEEKVDWYFSPLPEGQDLILPESKY
uniref:3-hydroxyisobutyryl-CoA hydrolase, mitochondrial n=1 Tax=Steinernema glaseri TaxID=37863 RepID=A0A1I7Z4E1_9BILA